MKFKPYNLLKARKQAKLTRDELAFRLKEKDRGITSRTLFNLEKGITNPSVDDLASLCTVLEKPVTYFFA